MSLGMETEKKWYVIHTYSGYENKVKANLERKIHSMGMEDKIFNVIVPVEEEIEKKNGKEKVVQRKIFPGYVLLEMIVDERSWYIVRNTPGVTGFVGSNTKPVPLTDEEAKRILKAMGMDEQGEESTEDKKLVDLDIEIGDKVNIKSGAFENFVATITEIDYSKNKIKGVVDMFGRETAVECGFDQIEKI
ncbi:transcription termination/antitermination protein NusG [Megamonas hypermegale]|uniref:Transcription termination/antitermination protein NusG n=2 Tax=Megamonas hypermegale TaxID=158847 RepID=A0A239TWC6_9FIRM|nr:transcription termination/antitermination protein NusG [Megamonas hypermegale]SNV01926.1 Transcription antitermination protein nusG [Megamonas hypermegale]